MAHSTMPGNDLDQRYTARMLESTQRLDPMASRVEEYGIVLKNKDF